MKRKKIKMEQNIDDVFMQFSQLITQLSTIEGVTKDLVEEEVVKMQIDQVELELPIQLDIVTDELGKVEIGGIPPLYYMETSFNPSFHQLKLTLTPIKASEF